MPRPDDTNTTTTTTTAATSDIVTLAMQLFDYTYAEAVAAINADATLKTKLNTIINSDGSTLGTNYDNVDDYYSDTYVYYVNAGYIKTNLNAGYLKVAYLARPTDEEGYPMVPDERSFIEACHWYVVMKLLYPMWMSGRVRDAVYWDAEYKWKHHMNKAYGRAMMPNADKMESFMNAWLRLYPDLHDFDSTFSKLGSKQFIYNH